MSLFRCLARLSPTHDLSRVWGKEGAAYVVCLRCGTRFEYDLRAMRITERTAGGEGAVEVKANA